MESDWTTNKTRLCHLRITAMLWNCNFKRFLNIFIAPIVCTIEITKNKTKFHSVATQVSAEMAVVMSFHDGSLPQNANFFFLFSPPILLQHCISSRLLVFFSNKTPFDFLFFLFLKDFYYYYFSLTNHTMSTSSFCKTITIQKSDSFMITFHTWGI